jgi:putative DNA methylase
MAFYRRRLPHLSETDHSVFLTWRLHDSLPLNRSFPTDSLSSRQAFAAMDRLLDEARSGPFYLRQPAVADMLVEAIQYNADVLGHYVLHAFVVMPNHVHLLATPAVALPKLTKSLKGITAKRANTMLAFAGCPFWQEESYDRLVQGSRGNPDRGHPKLAARLSPASVKIVLDTTILVRAHEGSCAIPDCESSTI